MKKIIFVLLFTMLMAAVLFAQNYTVQEVSGIVEKDLSGGRWEPVKAGDILTAETTIRTRIGAYITLKAGEQIQRIGSSRTGTIAALAERSRIIQIQGRISETDTSAVRRTVKRLDSASARAGSAEEDIEIDEE